MAKDKEVKSVDERRKEVLRNGAIILSLLGVLTFGEFLVAVIAPPWTFILWIAALWKTFYVVKDYMHIGRVFGGDGEAH
ncbi:MAG: hypothetical protein HYZ26_10300 [Chloroflexi bacterium]|nr:hypothetical protein [Chloroflexota bacterium]